MERFFRIKKAVLIFFCCLNITLYILYALLAKKITDFAINQIYTNDIRHHEHETLEELADGYIIAGLIIGVIMQVFGIVGAMRENVCLMWTYVFMTLVVAFCTLLKGIESRFHTFHLTGLLWYGINSLLALQFLFAIKRLRREQTRQISYVGSAYPKYAANKA